MRNKFLKTFGSAALAVLMIVTFAQGSVSAQEDAIAEEKGEQAKQEDSSQRRKARALEGVWNHTNTRRN